MATTLDTETEESCTTYNMLKVSSFLTFATELASQFTFFSYCNFAGCAQPVYMDKRNGLCRLL